MADPLSIVASVVAIVQITEKIIKVCRSYVEAVQDAPLLLRSVLNEISTMNYTFETLQLLLSANQVPDIIANLAQENGPIRGCTRAMKDLWELLPKDYVRDLDGGDESRGFHKKRKLKSTLKTLLWALSEERVKGLLGELNLYKTTISVQLTMGSLQSLADDRLRHILEWLKLTDPSPVHNRACALCEPQTGDWILRSASLPDWIDGKQRALWIYGIPGAGKTVLLSHLIQQLKQRCMKVQLMKTGYVYYYCSFAHNQDETAPFLRWLLNQLCRQGDFMTPGICKLFKEGVEPSVSDLLKALEGVLDRFDVAYVFIDALDESSSRHNLLRLVRNLLTEARFRKLQLLATSRDYPDIRRELEDVSLAMSMNNTAIEHDIRQYVRSTLGVNRRFRHWPREMLNEVELSVPHEARGMFRWAVCQLSALERLKPESHIVRNALKNLPKTLDETYDRILLEIPEDERLFVYYALGWIAFHIDLHGNNMPYPVLLEAARETTVEMDPNQSDIHYDVEILQEFCGCLVSTDSEFDVTFAHYTVREYLGSERFSARLASFFPSLQLRPASGSALKQQLIALVLTAANGLSKARGCLEDQFANYWMSSALLSLRIFRSSVAQEVPLRDLATSLLSPASSQFTALCRVSSQNSTHFLNREWPLFAHLDSITWLEQPSSTEIQHLFYLLLVHCDEDVANGLELARVYLRSHKARFFLTSTLALTHFSGDIGGLKPQPGARFQGTIFEFFAQWASHGSGPLYTLFEFGTGLYEPERVFLCFMFWHREKCLHHKSACILEKLIQEGADAKGEQYQITPLQMAVAACDRDGVEVLLRAGADVNFFGNPRGIAWDRHTIFDISGRYYSTNRPPYWHSLIFILREGLRVRWPYYKREQIARLLGQYGADTSLFFWGT